MNINSIRLDFEKEFPIPAHWITWSESKKRYDCHVGLADSKCSQYNKMFDVWKNRQHEVDELVAGNEQMLLRLLSVQNRYTVLQLRINQTIEFLKHKLEGTRKKSQVRFVEGEGMMVMSLYDAGAEFAYESALDLVQQTIKDLNDEQ